MNPAVELIAGGALELLHPFAERVERVPVVRAPLVHAQVDEDQDVREMRQGEAPVRGDQHADEQEDQAVLEPPILYHHRIDSGPHPEREKQDTENVEQSIVAERNVGRGARRGHGAESL